MRVDLFLKIIIVVRRQRVNNSNQHFSIYLVQFEKKNMVRIKPAFFVQMAMNNFHRI